MLLFSDGMRSKVMDVFDLFEIGSPHWINITNTKGIPGLFFMANEYW